MLSRTGLTIDEVHVVGQEGLVTHELVGGPDCEVGDHGSEYLVPQLASSVLGGSVVRLEVDGVDAVEVELETVHRVRLSRVDPDLVSGRWW